MKNFGRTLTFLLFLLLFLVGAKMAIRVVDPYTRRVSASLADALMAV